MIWKRDVTAFICASISADGGIVPNSNRVEIISTYEKERAKEVFELLRDEGIRSGINSRGYTIASKGYSLTRKKIYRVSLWIKGGQHHVLYWSIKKHRMERWIGWRKFKKLEELVEMKAKNTLENY